MGILSSKQKANNAYQWINRLKTTSVKQGFNKLGNSKSGYCCLGYGCKVLGMEYDSDSHYSHDFQYITGLKDNCGVTNKFMYKNHDSLTSLNDIAQLSFRRISTIIKNNVEQLFIPSVAKELQKLLNQ